MIRLPARLFLLVICALTLAALGAAYTSSASPLLDQVRAFLGSEAAVQTSGTTTDRTGVEMEALTAVAVALLTIYDMAKAIDKGMTITGVALLEKKGGASGDFRRATSDGT